MRPRKALHRTTVPLRSIAAGEALSLRQLQEGRALRLCRQIRACLAFAANRKQLTAVVCTRVPPTFGRASRQFPKMQQLRYNPNGSITFWRHEGCQCNWGEDPHEEKAAHIVVCLGSAAAPCRLWPGTCTCLPHPWPSATPTRPATAVPAPSPTATVPAAEPTAAPGAITVGIAPGFEPFIFVKEDKLAGFDIEAAQRHGSCRRF
jgi:hypothetical protein